MSRLATLSPWLRRVLVFLTAVVCVAAFRAVLPSGTVASNLEENSDYRGSYEPVARRNRSLASAWDDRCTLHADGIHRFAAFGLADVVTLATGARGSTKITQSCPGAASSEMVRPWSFENDRTPAHTALLLLQSPLEPCCGLRWP